MKQLVERHMKRVHPDPNGGCWLWGGAVDPCGYGRIVVGPREYKAHRVFYIAARGAIPLGTELDHLCRVRGCVNPAHLEPVTHQENMARGVFRQSFVTQCPSGHAYDVKNTYIAKNGQRQCRACTRLRMRKKRTEQATQRAQMGLR